MTAPIWTSSAAVDATKGLTERPWSATGVSIDTRTLTPGDLFVALRDARDGHDFVGEAFSRGASAALVERRPDNVAPDAPLLFVKDVLAGLQDMARFARARFRGKLVGVTGSVGKTGTKEMLRTMLSAQGTVHAAEKSFNNHWGVPLTLARMEPAADFAVLEIGMNAPGEIAPLALLARPHVAMITTVAAVHLEAFDDLTGIAKEKASILEGVEQGGAGVLNRDIETYSQLIRTARRLGVSPVRFGSIGRPEFKLIDARANFNGTSVSASARGERFFFQLGAPGKHLAMNALGALACVDALDADLARGTLALVDWRPPEGRGARWSIATGKEGEILLIDESYNANPAAMAAAFEVLAEEDLTGRVSPRSNARRVAFLGDMLELGPEAARFHADLAKSPAFDAITTVHCSGPWMRSLHESLPARQKGEWFPDAQSMAKGVGKLLEAGDVAMVKGSNGSRVGLVVEAIKRMGLAQRTADH